MNVMLTRAKCLLIIIGNHETLSIDPNWKEVIQTCKENGALVEKKHHPRIEAP